MSHTTPFTIGDTGLDVVLTVVNSAGAVDISAATSTTFDFLKPDRTTSTRTATFVTDGTDGQLTYTIESDLLDQSGVWHVRAHVVEPAKDYKTVYVRFVVVA